MSAPTSAPSATSTPGVNAPLAFISKTNQGGLIAVITALALTFVLVSFLIRGYIRYSNPPWKRDDHVFTAVTILSCVQSAVVFYEINEGLGKVHSLVSDHDLVHLQKVSRTPPISPGASVNMSKASLANNILYIIILFLSKCSVGFLYLRLSPVRRHKVTVWALLAVSALWAVMSILLITIECPWQSGCSNLSTRWDVIGTIDIITDFALFLVSIYLVGDLQMSWKPKAIVVGAFATKLLAIIPCALRLHYLSPNVLPTQRTLATSLVVVCTQLQIGYGTMAVTFPCLRPFVSVYEAGPVTTKQNSYYQQGSHSDIKLTSVESTTKSKSRRSQNRPPSGAAQPTFRPDLSTHTATVSYNHKKKTGGDTSSVHSHDSQKMFIERTVDYTVTYDERSLREDRLSSADGHA